MGIVVDIFGLAPTDFAIGANDWALCNIGDKIKIEIVCTVRSIAISSTDSPFIVNNTDGYIGSNWVTCTGGKFKDFKVGDVVIWGEYDTASDLGDLTIAQKLSDNEIQFSSPLVILGSTGNYIASNYVFSVKTPITGFKYQYNWKENSAAPNYISAVDGSEIILKHDAVNAGSSTPLNMEFLGNKDYQIGSATIEGVSITNTYIYESKFKIIHYTEMTPYIRAVINSYTQQSEYDSLLNGINPADFINAKCPKFIYKLGAFYEYTDPNRVQIFESTTTLGDTGGFGENFNTGLTNYSVATVFKNAADVAIPSLELTDAKQKFEITITNTTDTPFSNIASLGSVNFIKVPGDVTEYQMTGRTMYENFVRDHAAKFVGVGTIDGDNVGTGYQVFKNVNVAYTSSSIIVITGDIYLGPDALERLEESNDSRYIIWVTTANYTLDSDSSDRVNLIASINDFYENIEAPGLIVNENLFLRHPHDNFDIAGETEIAVFEYDEVVARSQFYIDRASYPTDAISIKSLRGKVKIKNSSTLQEFTLDSFNINTVGLPLDASGYQYVNITQPRSYHIPSSEPRKNIVIKRRGDLDTDDQFYYDFIFPFMIRWEYWEVLAAVNSAFFNTTEPNNGFNQEWERYSDESISANWKMYYEFHTVFDFNGHNLSYTDEAQIFNGLQNLPVKAWSFEYIKSFDPDFPTIELYDAVNMKKFILGYKNTLMKVLFKNTEAFLSGDVSVLSPIEVYEEGGVAGRRRFSSVQPMLSDTWMKEITTPGLIDLDFSTPDYVLATFLIDYTQLPNKPKFKIGGRLFEISAGLLGGKITEEDVQKITEGLIDKIIE